MALMISIMSSPLGYPASSFTSPPSTTGRVDLFCSHTLMSELNASSRTRACSVLSFLTSSFSIFTYIAMRRG